MIKKITKKSKKNGSRLQNDEDTYTKIIICLTSILHQCLNLMKVPFLLCRPFCLVFLVKSPVQMSAAGVRSILRSMSGSVQLKNFGLKSLTIKWYLNLKIKIISGQVAKIRICSPFLRLKTESCQHGWLFLRVAAGGSANSSSS